MRKLASVIIPCYNEAGTIVPIIREIKKSPFVGEIIIVDDGSYLATKKVLRSIGSVKIITHSVNRGKSAALYSGVKMASSDVILFIDADLTGLMSYHVNTLIQKFTDGHFDMVLGDRDRELWISRLLGLSVAYTGERVVRRQFLNQHSDDIFKGGYLVEPAMNRIFFNHYNVGKVILHDIGQIYKIRKNGIYGLWKDIKMHLNIITFLGIPAYFYQGFVAKRIPNS